MHGLAQGDYDLVLRGLLGDEAPLSASTVAGLKEKCQGEWEVWQSHPLEDLEVVYSWADGVYVEAGLKKEKALVLVVITALSDGRQEWLPGVHQELVRSVTRLEAKRDGLSAPGRGQRSPGNLGRLAQYLRRSREAALLKSPDCQSTGQGSQAAAPVGLADAASDSLCGNPSRGRVAQVGLSALVSKVRGHSGSRSAGSRLGPDGDFLQLSENTSVRFDPVDYK